MFWIHRGLQGSENPREGFVPVFRSDLHGGAVPTFLQAFKVYRSDEFGDYLLNKVISGHNKLDCVGSVADLVTFFSDPDPI